MPGPPANDPVRQLGPRTRTKTHLDSFMCRARREQLGLGFKPELFKAAGRDLAH